MKATELMIGDLVYASKDEHTVLKVMTINGNTADCIWDVNNECDMNIGEFKPIHLTPEILEKNGFTKEYGAAWNIYRFSASWFVLYKKEFGFMLSVGSYEIPIKYVHELQHALKLCGIDKEITL